jgi:hypothetical protein
VVQGPAAPGCQHQPLVCQGLSSCSWGSSNAGVKGGVSADWEGRYQGLGSSRGGEVGHGASQEWSCYQCDGYRGPLSQYQPQVCAYIEDCCPSLPSPTARDPHLAAALWEVRGTGWEQVSRLMRIHVVSRLLLLIDVVGLQVLPECCIVELVLYVT